MKGKDPSADHLVPTGPDGPGDSAQADGSLSPALAGSDPRHHEPGVAGPNGLPTGSKVALTFAFSRDNLHHTDAEEDRLPKWLPERACGNAWLTDRSGLTQTMANDACWRRSPYELLYPYAARRWPLHGSNPHVGTALQP